MSLNHKLNYNNNNKKTLKECTFNRRPRPDVPDQNGHLLSGPHLKGRKHENICVGFKLKVREKSVPIAQSALWHNTLHFQPLNLQIITLSASIKMLVTSDYTDKRRRLFSLCSKKPARLLDLSQVCVSAYARTISVFC